MVATRALLAGLFALTAQAQNANVFYLRHINTPASMQEFTAAVRSAADLREAVPDAAKWSLIVRDTDWQLRAVEWLVARLDRPAGASGISELWLDDASAPLVQVVNLSHMDELRQMQEIVNAIRAITDIHRLSPVAQQKALILRGALDDVQLADWLVGVMDQPAGVQRGSSQDYRVSQPSDPRDTRGRGVLAIFLSHLHTPQEVQETINVARAISDITRCMPVSSRNLLVMRGTDEQIALLNWLLKHLDGPPGQGTIEFNVGGPGSRLVQVAFVNAQPPQRLQETANEIRSETKMLLVFPFNPQKAIVMRGTADQLARAQQIIVAQTKSLGQGQ
jgi:hypothetical protein